MEKVLNINAKIQYEYKRCWVWEVSTKMYKDLFSKADTVGVKKGKNSRTYIEQYCGFDIETYTSPITECGYMYIWQFSIDRLVVKGRTWQDFKSFLDNIELFGDLAKNRRLLVWVANLSYEWQFIRHHMNVTDYFFKDLRNILYFTHNDCIDFKDCLPISGGSLQYLAKTYTNTQKCKCDLDYSIPRNYKTLLTKEEESYCDNDVLILSEWSRYFFDEYLRNGRIPLTMQSIIREDIKENAIEWWTSKGNDKKGLQRAILSMFPSENCYNHIMKWTFRGGYVHGNLLYCGEKLTADKKIKSYDFTSSYPSVMEHDYFPARFVGVKDGISIEEYEDLIKDRCVVAIMEFTNIKSRFMHSIESKSKCMDLSNDAIIDNGRVRMANKMVVSITEVDYQIYKKFYTWDSVEVVHCMKAKRMKLPDYLLKTMEKDYTLKAILKRQGNPYAVPKSRANCYYGVTCTRLNDKNVEIDENGEPITVDADSYNKQICGKYLLPQWSLYVTAHARYRLLSVAYSVEKLAWSMNWDSPVLYMDTDSIKIIKCDRYDHIIKEYNNRIINENKKMCERRNLDFSIYWDLGALDYEGRLFELKYLGAKRYIYTHFDSKKKGLACVQTVAGLPKGKLIELYPNRVDLYNNFKNNMEVFESGKLTSKYHDCMCEEIITDTQGNACRMKELSSIGLVSCDFTMTLDGAWLMYFLEYQKQYELKEKR